MAAIFGWKEFNGAASTGTPTNVNMGSINMRNLTPATYPITAGDNSYEKWIYGDWSGTFTKINNVRFWKSGGSLVSGEDIVFDGEQVTTTAPGTAISVIAVASVDTSDPGYTNVSINGATTLGSLTSAGTSDYIVLQSQIDSSAGPGATNQKTFTIQYDEI